LYITQRKNPRITYERDGTLVLKPELGTRFEGNSQTHSNDYVRAFHGKSEKLKWAYKFSLPPLSPRRRARDNASTQCCSLSNHSSKYNCCTCTANGGNSNPSRLPAPSPPPNCQHQPRHLYRSRHSVAASLPVLQQRRQPLLDRDRLHGSGGDVAWLREIIGYPGPPAGFLTASHCRRLHRRHSVPLRTHIPDQAITASGGKCSQPGKIPGCERPPFGMGRIANQRDALDRESQILDFQSIRKPHVLGYHLEFCICTSNCRYRELDPCGSGISD